jgi:hypothetical protein
MSEIIKNARKIRAAILAASPSLTDEVASTAPEMFATYRADNSFIAAGTRVRWNDVLKKAAVNLWATEENNPDNAPNLWENLGYKDGIRIIPETITATTAFAQDEYGWWGATLYRSLINANVYTPDQYSAGWEVVQ